MQNSPPRSLAAMMVFGMVCCATCLPANAGELTLYVSTVGRDSWSGRLAVPNAAGTDGPFASITRARDAIRQKKSSDGGLEEPVTVQIRGGTYRLAEPVTFTPEDSGTKDCPVTYAAYPGEQPVLCGSRAITGWKPWRDKIQCAFLPVVKAGTWYFRSLFVNGRRQTRARYPNPDPADPCRKGFLYTRRGDERLYISGTHKVGDTLDYEVEVPAVGDYAVWLCYGHGMKKDMGGKTSLAVDGGTPAPLLNLPDTRSWRAGFRWARAAGVQFTAGKHTLRWHNDKEGNYSLDVFAFSDDSAWTPHGGTWPTVSAGRHLVVAEAEEFVRADAPLLGFGIVDVNCGAWGRSAGESKTVFSYGTGDVKSSWAAAPEAEVHIWPPFESCRAYKQITRLAKIDAVARTVTISGPECITALGIGDRYFVENVLEELDSPGEWYLDRQTGMLYYWPPGEMSNGVEVSAPLAGRLIQFEGDETKGQNLHHVRWSGLTFMETDYSPDDGCVGYKEGNNGVIYLRGAVNCAVESCRFVNNGKAAVLLQGGLGNTVSGNDISDSAEGGILVLDSAANTVSDNHIHHLGAVYKHVAGVVVRGPGAQNNVLAHNLVHDITRWGMGLMQTGTGNVVEYNEMYNTSLETYDTGGIHAYQDDRRFLCNTVIRYNLVRDGVGYSSIMGKPVLDSRGIYIDGFSSGYTITHNIVYRNSANGGIFVQGGRDIRICNNICVDNGNPQYMHANFLNNSANLQFKHNILGTQDDRVELLRIYQGGEKVTQFGENLYWHPRPTFPGVGTFAAWQAMGRDTHSLLGDPLFVAPDKDDYSLQPGSPALKLGFEPIDAGKIGLLRKRCSCSRTPVPWGSGASNQDGMEKIRKDKA